MLKNKNILISVIGMGYVGLPLANHLSKKFQTIGFDINEDRRDNNDRRKDDRRFMEDRRS